MNNSHSREISKPLDSLDIHHEQFNRSKRFSNYQPKEEVMFKNFYKQQLDEILHKKNKYKSLEKQKQEQEKMMFNDRLKLVHQAERIKQLSYKNYYQMIMNNQENIKNKYISPFQESDDIKERFIEKGVQEGKIRSQNDYEKQIRRQQNVKKQFQTVLNYQKSQKQESSKKDFEDKNKSNQHIRNILLTPQQVQRLQRQRKMADMNKYKEDLDRHRTQKYSLSQSQFQNPEQTPPRSTVKSDKHNLLLNPLPFNIQNPYILKEMQRKNMLSSNSNNLMSISDPNQYTQTKRNIFG